MKNVSRIAFCFLCGISILTGIFANNGVVFAAYEWSSWEDSKPSLSSDYEIEERTIYRYRDKETTTNTNSSLTDWTRDDSKTITTWSDWSAWQDTEVTESSTREVNTRKVYRYRDKSTTTSTNSSLSGWTRDDTKTVTTWGNWSAWQDQAVTKTSTREVKTQSVVASYKTQYNYWGYRSGNNAHFCDICGKNQYGGTWSYQETGWLDYELSPRSGWGAQQCAHRGVCYKSYSYNSKVYYWVNTQQVPASYKTQYSYRDATITYSYYKWSDWSDWSTTAPSSASDRETDDKIQYNYRDSITTYTYYKWSNWSDWNVAVPAQQENRDVENKIQYRYRAIEKPTEITTQAPQQDTSEKNMIFTPLKPDTNTKPVKDKKISEKGKSLKDIKKGSKLVGTVGKYTVTDVKKQTVEYSGIGNQKISVVVPDEIKYKNKIYKVTSISSSAFCNNKKIKKVIIGKNVKKIEKNTFRNCKKLKKVTIGKNVTSIGDCAFYGCSKLSKVDVYSSKIKKVGKKSFYKIAKHPKIRVPKKKIALYKKMFEK